MLADRGYRVSVYDPLAQVPKAAHTLEEAVSDSDAVLLAVNHTALKDIDPVALAPLVRTPVLIDCHNFFASEAWSSAGFKVYALGRGSQFATRPIATRPRSSFA
jgi:UDPglucose 6-dehydrogenase